MQTSFAFKKVAHGISYTQVQRWVAQGLHAGFADRSLDVRSDYSRWQQFSSKKLLLLKQIHSAEIVDLRQDVDLSALLERPQEADAWIADFSVPQLQEFTLGIETADCTPVLISVLNTQKVALCHCGWRGAVSDLLPKVLQNLLIDCSESSIEIAIGPAASGACYEVGSEVVTAVEEAWQRSCTELPCEAILHQHSKTFADISALLFQQALHLGIPVENIMHLPHCTISNENYFSYRRNPKHPGRQLSFVELLK